MKKFLLIFLMSVAQVGYTQPIRFQKEFLVQPGFIQSNLGDNIMQTNDGGYLLCGKTHLPTTTPVMDAVYVIRTDSNGITLWKKKYGFPLAISNQLMSVTFTDNGDGNYIIAATIEWWYGGTVDPIKDICYFKIDGNGNIIWSKRYNGAPPTLVPFGHHVSSIEKTLDGGYIMGGYGFYKIDSMGNMMWVHGGYGSYYVPLSAVRQNAAGAFFGIMNQSTSISLHKKDSSGNNIWRKSYSLSTFNLRSDFRILNDGFIVLGETDTSVLTDICVLRLDTAGNVLWSKRLGGAGHDYASSIQLASDGGFIIAGKTESFGTSGKAYLVKLDSAGNHSWSKIYREGSFASVAQTNDRGYIAIGTSVTGKIYVVKTDSIGNSGCFDTAVNTMITSVPAVDSAMPVTGNYILSFNVNNTLPQISGGGIATTLCPSCSSPTPASITANGPIKFCQGGSVVLSASTGVSYLWSNNATTQNITVNTTGNYSVTITDSNGCTSTSSIINVIVDTPAIPVVAVNVDTLTSSAATSYQWYINGSIITGATSQNYVATQSGNYSVTITDNNGCTATSVPYSLAVSSIGEIRQIQLLVYPNPTDGKFTVSFSAPKKINEVSVSIATVTGSKVIQESFKEVNNSFSHTVDLSEMAKGVYFIEVKADGERVVRKVVVE